MASSAQRPLAELLADLADRTPAPGGGSASAWAGALAAALAEMVSRFADDPKAAAEAMSLRAELLAAGELELTSYRPVLDAWRLPAQDPSREARLAAAFSEASHAPLAIARASTQVAELAARIAEISKPELAGDAIAAVLLADASSRAAARLVEINLAGRQGDPRLKEVAELVERSGAGRAAALGRR